MNFACHAIFYCYRIHIAVTLLHTADGMADQFIKDITSLIAEIMKNPTKPVEGEVKNQFLLKKRTNLTNFVVNFQLAFYGVAQTLSDRTLVADIIRCHLDAMYYTPKAIENGK